MPGFVRGLVFAAGLAAGSAVALSAESVTFRFAPPTGGEYRERELRTSESRVGGNRDVSTVAILSGVKISREAGAVYVTQRIEELAASKNGGKFESMPVLDALRGVKVVTVIAPDGSLVRVQGYEQLLARARPHMTEEARAAADKQSSDKRQGMSDRLAWYELEMLFGQTLELDRDYWYPSAWLEDSGWTHHHTLVRVGPWVAHPQGGRLLTLRLAYVPDAVAAVPGAKRLSPLVPSRFDPAKVRPVVPGLRVEGTSNWLVDPVTGMVWKLQSHRKVSAPLPVNDEIGLTLVTEEDIDRSLERLPRPKS